MYFSVYYRCLLRSGTGVQAKHTLLNMVRCLGMYTADYINMFCTWQKA